MPASIYRSFSFARWISILPSFNLSLGFLLFYLHVRYAYDKFSISLTSSFSHFLRSCFSSYWFYLLSFVSRKLCRLQFVSGYNNARWIFIGHFLFFFFFLTFLFYPWTISFIRWISIPLSVSFLLLRDFHSCIM